MNIKFGRVSWAVEGIALKGGGKIGEPAEEKTGRKTFLQQGAGAKTIEQEGAGKAGTTILSPTKTQKSKKNAVSPAEPTAIEGTSFNIDLTWLNETMKIINWSEKTAKTWIASRFKIDTQGKLTEVLARLTREQAEQSVHELQKRATEVQTQLFQ